MKKATLNVGNATNTDVNEVKRLATKFGVDLESFPLAYNFGSEMDALMRSNPIKYPQQVAFTTYSAYKGGRVLGTGLSSAELALLKKEHPDLVYDKVVDNKSYNEQLKAYHAHATEVNTLFLGGLYYLTGTIDNPKAAKAYQIAYEDGHASGFQEIANVYDTLTELII